jgi:hypothetical protein
MANMTPEERQAFMERMRARGFDPEAMMSGRGGPGGGTAGAGGRQGGAGNAQQAAGQPAGASQRRQNASPPAQSVAARAGSATTIDALFGPLPPTESFGQVWRFAEGKLVRFPLRVGISDGQQSEIIQGDVKEGEEVVTSVITAAQRAATNAGSTAFPGFQQNRGGGGFPGGGGGGGPRGGGGAPRGGGR